MASTPVVLIAPKYAENSQTTQYTSSAVKTIVDKFTVTNVSGSNATFAANLVISSGTAGASNNVLKARTIAPGEMYPCPELVGQMMEAGGFISTLAGTASALVISAAGRQIT